MNENERKKSVKGSRTSMAIFQTVIFFIILIIAITTVMTSMGWLPDKISFDVQLPKIIKVVK